jgi:hypothetical protein
MMDDPADPSVLERWKNSIGGQPGVMGGFGDVMAPDYIKNVLSQGHFQTTHNWKLGYVNGVYDPAVEKADRAEYARLAALMKQDPTYQAYQAHNVEPQQWALELADWDRARR